MSAPGTLSAFNGRVVLQVQIRALWAMLGLALALIAVTVAALMSGSFPLDLHGVWATLIGDAPSDMAATVVWQFRFPRALTAALTGALFGVSGLILQTITRNPLADPSLVGVSQGASLAVVALIVLSPEISMVWRPVIAFGGALAVAGLIQSIAMRRSQGATMRFILTGIGVAAFISSITSAMLTYGNIDQVQSALGWLAGSIHAAGWGEVSFLSLCLLLLIPLLVWSARAMSALRMGAEIATGLGLRVQGARIGLITLSVALAAFGVAAVGPLGFVGLVAPHMAQRLARAGVGQQVILTALTGALMVALADYTGRIAFAPIQIPAGILTAILGVPVFVLLIFRGSSTRAL